MSSEAQASPEQLAPLIDARRIASRLTEMAVEIQAAIPAAERPVAVVVLQGAFIFAADLLREFSADYPIEVAFLRCQSYGPATRSSGKVLLLQDIDSELDLRGRTVLLIDDILDTGGTMKFLAEHLLRRGAARVSLCVLLKRAANQERWALRPDFSGFEAGAGFVVGYGLDINGRHRHLPYLATLNAE